MTPSAQDFKYLVKADEDIFLAVPDLIKAVTTSGLPRSCMYCLVHPMAPVLRNESEFPQWKLPEQVYPQEELPEYCNGPAYVVSRPAAACLFKRKTFLEIFWKTSIFFAQDAFTTIIFKYFTDTKDELYIHIEDAYLGLIIQDYCPTIKLVNDENFLFLDDWADNRFWQEIITKCPILYSPGLVDIFVFFLTSLGS